MLFSLLPKGCTFLWKRLCNRLLFFFRPNSEHSVTDEPVLKPAQSTQESVLVSAPDIAELREEEGLELDKKEAGDVGVSPGLMTSPSVIVSVSDTLPSGEVVESKTDNKDYEKEALSDISTVTAKSFLLSRTKTGLSDLSTAKSGLFFSFIYVSSLS